MKNNFIGELVEIFLNKAEMKYKYDSEGNEYRVVLNLISDEDESFIDKLEIFFVPNNELKYVNILLPIDGYLSNHKGLMKTLNTINRSIEFGTVFSKEIEGIKGMFKVYYRHTLLIRDSKEFFTDEQFGLLVSYMSFVKEIINEEFGEKLKVGKLPEI